MIGWFKSRKKPELPYEDKVWMDGERKLAGLCDDVQAATQEGLAVIVIAHFEATRAAVEQALRERSIQHQRSLSSSLAPLCDSIGSPSGAKVWLLLRSAFADLSSGGSPSGGLAVLIAEHHPMESREQELLERIAAHPCVRSIRFHIALTDPLMQKFGGERLIGMMKSLGGDTDEVLSHPMISSSIRRAQEKIENKVRRETDAQSAEEWIRVNVEE